MKKIARVLLAVVTTACGIAISAGTSYSATSSQTGPPSSSGSAAGGAAGESLAEVAGVAEKCTDREQPGACLSIKGTFTVERVTPSGAMKDDSGGASGTAPGGTINGAGGEPQDRDPGGATGDNGVYRGDGVTGSEP